MTTENQTNTPPIWFIVDGNNQVVTDAHGTGVMNAANTFLRRLQKLIEYFNPVVTVVCWDSSKSFRHDLRKDYKAGRIRLPGIECAIQAARNGLDHVAGLASMEVEGFEADDLIATLADAAIEHQARAVLYSKDRDLQQLIRKGQVTQLLHAKRVHLEDQRLHFKCTYQTEDMMKDLVDKSGKKIGILPSQWVDYQILVGQPGDNIRGVDGIGDLTARGLLRACDSIDGYFQNQWRAALSKSQAAALANSRHLIPHLRQLCTLRRDVPLPEMWLEGV